MRSLALTFALLMAGACDASNEGDSEAMQDVEALPEGTDLELGSNGSGYFSFADCPAQDTAHIRVGLTAPLAMDIVSAKLLSFEFVDVLHREGSEIPSEAVPPLAPIAAGEQGEFVFNVPVEGGPVLCTDGAHASLGSVELVLLLDVHGTQFEVEGDVELWCSTPAPHTC